MDGVLRGKYMGVEKFMAALDKGFGFCDVILGWDSNDQLYDNTTFTGWHTGYPDAEVRIVPETCRDLPHEFDGRGLFFLAAFAGAAEAVCPRGLLARVLARAKDHGLAVTAALEYEFFVFDETPESAAAKGYRDLQPITPGNFGYSVLRNSTWADLYGDLLKMCTDMNFPLEGLHTETGPGVLEASLDKDLAMAAADKAALFKTFAKVEAQRHGLMATFMAKWSEDYPGQSGHIHLSMNKIRGGGALFHDARAEGGISTAMRHAPFYRRTAELDAGAAGHDRAHHECLYPADPRLLGPDGGDLGHRQPDLRPARDRRRGEIPTSRIPGRRRRCQPLPGPGRRHRLRPVGPGTEPGTDRPRAGQRL